MESAKFHAKIGDQEFHFEGPPELVEKWRREHLVARSNGSMTKETPESSRTEFDSLLRNVFVRHRKDKRGYISLRRLPQTETKERDSFILTLYAYRVMEDMNEMTASPIKDSLRESKLPVERLYSIQERASDYISSTGEHRSKRYSLTEKGSKRAEELIRSFQAQDYGVASAK